MSGIGDAEQVSGLFDAFNRRDWEGLGGRLADDVEVAVATTGDRVQGREEVLASAQRLVIAYPDVQLELTGSVPGGQRTAAEFVLVGTRSADESVPIGKVQPGESVREPGALFARTESDRVSTVTFYFDVPKIVGDDRGGFTFH